MDGLQNEFRDRFNKSDALTELKNLSEKMSKEEFIKFSFTAMKSAYDKNRVKAVEYMLNFHEKDNPQLLLRIHLQVMLHDPKDFESGKKMLKVLAKHYSPEFCQEVIEAFVNYHQGKLREQYHERSKELLKLILEVNLPTNTDVGSKRPKI